jgi:uncharacterized protein YndB with AHSA1/START domain
VSAEAQADREIVTIRVVHAPRALVYRAWTEREHVARWWGPKGFTNTFDVFDPRPGGAWRFTMHGPDGKDYKNHSVFVELAPPQRIVLDKVSRPIFRMTATFDPERGGTRVTFRGTFETAEECARIKAFAADANEELMDRLELELARMAAPGPAREFTFTRLIDAPRERVYAAWAEPERMAKWFAPRPFALVVHAMDFRPGGRFRMAMRGPDGSDFPFSGRYGEILPAERLTWSGELGGGPPEQVSTVVTFRDEGRKTRLDVRQTFHVVTPDIAQALEGADAGWNMTLDQLQAHVTGAG